MAPTDVLMTVRCTACGSTVTARLTIRQTGRTASAVIFSVHADRDDTAWLHLFDEAHSGPLERVR